ncbi:MAG: TrkA family potassium uptake protein [Bacteroidales bacterium]|jgi:trk system potassium uptake protein TrkA|nr:TrkA family potassium uptake protein [Bacteroidales bacterium]
MAQEKFAVIGAGHFGQAISLALSEKGHEVLVIDNDINVIQEISEDVAYAVCVDATNKRALLNENILSFDAVIVSIGNDFVGRLLCTANLLDVGVKRIICRVMGKSQRTILEKMGITEFLSPEDEVGTLLAERLTNPNMISYLQLPDEYKIAEVITPKRLIGLSIGDINFRDNHRLSLITIRRNFEELVADKLDTKQHILGVPDNKTVIQDGDVFVIFGKEHDIDNFIKINL